MGVFSVWPRVLCTPGQGGVEKVSHGKSEFHPELGRKAKKNMKNKDGE